MNHDYERRQFESFITKEILSFGDIQEVPPSHFDRYQNGHLKGQYKHGDLEIRFNTWMGAKVDICVSPNVPLLPKGWSVSRMTVGAASNDEPNPLLVVDPDGQAVIAKRYGKDAQPMLYKLLSEYLEEKDVQN